MSHDRDELIPTRWTLIERLKNWEDQKSWREFFDTYWKLIYGVARKSGLSHPEAQDAVQETVMSVCKNLPAFKADPAYGSFKNWLLTVTRWRIADQVRKRGHEQAAREHRPGFQSEADNASTPTEERIPDPAGNQLDALWNEEWQKHLVEAALEKVERQASAKHYQVFYLQAIKQVSPEAVAKATNVSVDQVYLIKHRLSKIFRAAVQDLETKLG